MKIEILGPGCARCHATENNVRLALTQLNVSAEIDHIYDPKEFAKRGVLLTPAVIIDGVLMVSGKIPQVEDIKSWVSAKAKADSVQSET
jgi:small redox-active disulfide protein 2